MEDEREDIVEEEELDDIEIAEVANEEIRKRDKEIADLKKKFALEKMRKGNEEEEEEKVMTKKECLDIISNPNSLNYDYAQATVNLHDMEVANGNVSPLGKKGKEVRDFLSNCIEECNGDKSKFTHIYQSNLKPDDPKVTAAYNSRNR